LLRFCHLTFEARNITALAKNYANNRQDAEYCPAREKHQENDDQRCLPNMIENEPETYWLRIAQGKDKQNQENDEPKGPSQKIHGFKKKKGQ